MAARLSKEVRTKLLILALTMFLVMVGFSILFPIMPLFIKLELHGTARDIGFLFALYSLVQFFCAPLWGMWSDRRGRKPALMVGIFGIMLTFALIAASTDMWHLYAARIIGGLLTSAALPAVFAYAADLTTKEQRGPAIGMIGGSLAMGIVFGPAIGGIFSQHSLDIPAIGFHLSALRVPFLIGAVLGAVNFLLVVIFIRQTGVPAEHAAERMGPVTRVVVAFKSHLRHYFFFAVLVSTSFACLTSTFTLFANTEFGLDAKHIGMVFAIFGFAGAFVQGGLSGKLINRFGEAVLIKIGVPMMAIGFIFITIAPNVLLFTVFSALVGASQGLLFPSIASAISKGSMVGQGGALGLYDSMDAMGRIVGPIAGGLLYEAKPLAGSHHWPYYFGAFLLFASILVGMYGLKEIKHKEWVEELVEAVAEK